MEEKIKITQKEIDEMYDVEKVLADNTKEHQEANAEVSFEEFSVEQDKEALKKYKEELD